MMNTINFNQSNENDSENEALIASLTRFFPVKEASHLIVDLKQIPEQQSWLTQKSKLSLFINDFAQPAPLLPDFKYFVSAKLYSKRVELNNPSGRNKEDVIKLSLPHLLCKDNILYSKKKNLFYEISLDSNHPRFVQRDVVTDQKQIMSFGDVEKIVGHWLGDTAMKTELTKELNKLYTPYSQKGVILKKPTSLPSLTEFYYWQKHRLNYYSHFYSARRLENESNIYITGPIMCDDNQIVYLTDSIIYKIQLKNQALFEKLTLNNISLITERELFTITREVNNKQIFGDQTLDFTTGIKKLHKNLIEPILNMYRSERVILNNVTRPYSFNSLSDKYITEFFKNLNKEHTHD